MATDPKDPISMDQLEDLVRALNADYEGMYDALSPGMASGEDLDALARGMGLNRLPTSCSHEWIEYIGLMESYTFCKKCDKRKE